jgi:hypothetical protein
LSEESKSRDNQASVIGPVIELATIDERHRQPGLLKEFGTKVILRLGVNPVLVVPGTLKRAITVDRISPGSGKSRWDEIREIGWADLPADLEDCEWVRGRLDENTITEQAAIGVMLLLINELEGGVSTTVLQVGSGGDYLIRLEGRPDPVQVEVRGIKSGSAGQASSRLGEKCGQIRGAGFASVTTFQHGKDGAAHSYLHFVVPGNNAEKTKRGRRKGKRGKRP